MKHLRETPQHPGQSHMTSVPQTPDGKHIAVAQLVGAGFKPALVPQARCEGIAVISCAIEVRTAKLGSTSHTVNAERGRVCGAPQKTHPRFLGTPTRTTSAVPLRGPCLGYG